MADESLKDLFSRLDLETPKMEKAFQKMLGGLEDVDETHADMLRFAFARGADAMVSNFKVATDRDSGMPAPAYAYLRSCVLQFIAQCAAFVAATDEQRRKVAAELRELAANRHYVDEFIAADTVGFYRGEAVEGFDSDSLLEVADLIDRPVCHDLVEHKQDPFIPGKRMADGYFHCSSCDWSGQLLEYIGFGDMLAFEPVHCPKCGEKIERRR